MSWTLISPISPSLGAEENEERTKFNSIIRGYHKEMNVLLRIVSQKYDLGSSSGLLT